MRIIYDSGVDSLRILLRNAPIEESVRLSPNLIADFDTNRDLVSIELLDASAHVHDLREVELVQIDRPAAADLAATSPA